MGQIEFSIVPVSLATRADITYSSGYAPSAQLALEQALSALAPDRFSPPRPVSAARPVSPAGKEQKISAKSDLSDFASRCVAQRDLTSAANRVAVQAAIQELKKTKAPVEGLVYWIFGNHVWFGREDDLPPLVQLAKTARITLTRGTLTVTVTTVLFAKRDTLLYSMEALSPGERTTLKSWEKPLGVQIHSRK